MFSLVPPAKALFSYRAVWNSLWPVDWESVWRAHFGAHCVSGHPSGRSAFRQIIHSLGTLKPGCDEIVLPAYTCPSLINTVWQTGMTPRLIDMDEASPQLSIRELRAAINRKTLAVVTTNLYGTVDPVDDVLSICRENRVYLIEDISLALGCDTGGRALGTFGDVIFFSLGLSKVITTINGGIVCWRNEALATEIAADPGLRKIDWRAFFLQLLYPIALSRFGFALIDRTPWRLRDGQDFADRHRSRWTLQQARLSALLLPMVETDSRARRVICGLIKRHQSELGRDFLQTQTEPKLTRYPCLADSEEHCEAILRRLRQAGILGSRGFKHIEKFIDIEKFPNTHSLVSRLYTLPCYPGISAQTTNRIFAQTDQDNEAMFSSVQNQYSALVHQHGRDSKASGHADIAFRMRKKLLKYQLRKIPGRALSVLDSGCGNGVLGPLLRETLEPAALDGADFVSESLRIAENQYGYTTTFLTNVLSINTVIGRKKYDFVNSCEVVLYIPPDQYRNFFDAHRRCLTDGGYFLLTLPNLKSVYRLFLTPDSNFRYLFSPEDVLKDLTKTGFDVVSVAGIDLFGIIPFELSRDLRPSFRRRVSFEISILCKVRTVL